MNLTDLRASPTETKKTGFKSIAELFEEQVIERPNSIALSFEDKRLTYRDLDRRAEQLAGYLSGLGVGPESLVCLLMERSIEMVTGILGILKCGAAYVPIDPAYPANRQQFILSDSQARVLLSQKRFAGGLSEYQGRVLFLDEALSPDDPAKRTPGFAKIHPDNAAYVIYTSGSTGQPKGVVVTHHNVLRLLERTEAWYRFNEHDVWTMFHSYAFDFSVWEIWGALLYGGRLVLVPYWISRSPRNFVELVFREQVTVLNQTPSAFLEFMRAEEEFSKDRELPLRLVIFGGEALDFASLREWMERHGDANPQLVNMYGITETTVHVTYRPIRREESTKSQMGSRIGEPISDLQLYVLDQQMKSVRVGETGAIYVGGCGLARGYLNRTELTADRFVPNPFGNSGDRLYRSGDRARLVDSSDLEYLGREDNQIKVRGFRIELGEIEAELARQQGVRSCAVLAEDLHGETRLAAYVVAAKSITEKLIRSHLQSRLPAYMVPAKIVLLENMPLTENGKLDRRKLSQQTAVLDLEIDDGYIAPRTEMEKAIAQIWEELLGVGRIGIQDNFFDRGGHSLAAMRMVAAIKEHLGVNIGVKDAFDLPSLAALAARALSPQGDETTMRVVPPHRNNLKTAPLSFAQQTGWFFKETMPPDSFPMALAHRLTGNLDIPLLEKSVNQIICRHEILRTRFVDGVEEPIQVIEPECTIRIATEDLSHLPAEEQPSVLHRRIHEVGRHPFDLSLLPLLRVCVFRLASQDYVLLVSMHHFLGDGWSMKLFYRELQAIYKAYGQSEELSIEEPPVQFADCVLWQRERLQKGILEKELAYWEGQLAGISKSHPRRPDLKSLDLMRYEAANERFNLSQETTLRLKQLSKNAGATLHMTMLAICALLLHGYRGGEEVLIGAPISTREHEHLRRVMGIFMNMMVIRLTLKDDPTFAGFLQQVRETTLGAYAHHEVPLESVLEHLRDQSGNQRAFENPYLCQSMFNMLDADERALALPGLESEEVDFDDGAAQFDLAFEVQDRKSYLHVRIVYKANSSLTTGLELRQRFERLVSEVLDKTSSPISQFDLRLPHEREMMEAMPSLDELAESFQL